MSGTLWVVIGASGAGKDTLLRQLAHEVREAARIRIARRWITRAAHASEDHLAIDDARFDALLAQDAFALHWAANGARYGIGREIDAWLAAGDAVVVNGSRAHLAQVFARYPQARVVQVRVRPELLAARLAARGRESSAEIAARIARSAALEAQDAASAHRVDTIDNNADPERAARALRRLIEGAAPG